MNDQNVSEKKCQIAGIPAAGPGPVGQFYGTLARLPVWLLAHLLATFMFTERGRDYKPVVPKLVSAVT